MRTNQWAQSSEEPSQILSILASASDVRDVARIFRKRPKGLSLTEPMDAFKKRILEPQKLAAYEYWGIINRDSHHVELSQLGWDLAQELTPEIYIFRAILDRLPLYRATLEWVDHQDLDRITHTEITTYWNENFATGTHANREEPIKAHAVSFFHLCQAADLGTVTLGKRGQPTRLRVDREELARYINAEDLTPIASASTEGTKTAQPHTSGTDASPAPPPSKTAPSPLTRKLRAFISHRRHAQLADQIRVALGLLEIECEIEERTVIGIMPIPEQKRQTMQHCTAGLVIVTADDCKRDEMGNYLLDEIVMIEIGAACGLYGKRVALLWEKDLPKPGQLKGLRTCEFEKNGLTWEAGVQLMQAIKEWRH